MPFEELEWADRRPAVAENEAPDGYDRRHALLEPQTIPLARFERKRSPWKFW